MPTLYTHAITAVVATALASGAAWWTQDTRYTARIAAIRADHAKVLQDIADKTARVAQLVRARETQIRQQLATLDVRHQKELTHARRETDRLRDCVRTGTCGVRLIAAPAASACPGRADAGAGGLGDGAGALDGDVQSRVLDHREAVYEDAAKLAYLQDYARACRRAGGEGIVAPKR